jgi:hypothetical protein
MERSPRRVITGLGPVTHDFNTLANASRGTGLDQTITEK